MPSLSHRLLAFAMPRVRPAAVITDPSALRERLVAKNRGRQTSPPAWLSKEFVVTVESVGGEDGFPAYVARPRRGTVERTLVHLHGGSFTAVAHDRQWRWAARLASRTSARLVFPAYPLAPEHTWRDSVPALTAYVAGLCDQGEVVLAGDSAGGGMALAVALGLRDRWRAGEGTQPAKLVLIAPWADLTRSAPGTEESAARDPWLSLDNHDTYALFWAGGEADLVMPEVSPALGDLTDLPPTMLLCGTHDLLYAGAEALAARAAAVGWPLVFEVGHGLLHVYPILPVTEARGALKRVAAFISG